MTSLFLLVTVLSFLSVQAAPTNDHCEAIHAKMWGIEITCCASDTLLPDKCDYSNSNSYTLHHCPFAQGPCGCSVSIDTDHVTCSTDVSIAVWKDHYHRNKSDPFQNLYLCRNPNLPNPDKNFVLSLSVGSRVLPNDFYLGLSRYRMSELELCFKLGALEIMPDNIFTYFRYLKRLKMTSYDNPALHQGILQGLSDLHYLEALTIKNFTLPRMWQSAAHFAPSLKYLQIDHVDFQHLPLFVEAAAKLEYLKVQYTQIQDVAEVGNLPNLKLCFVPRNRIRSLAGTKFLNSNLTDMDLSHNKIDTISKNTFAGLVSLTFLDLSDNPISQLPSGVFSNLNSLKWLHLKHESIKDNTTVPDSLRLLEPQHFIGLNNLQYLSLANNPSIQLDHSVFKPLHNLRKLDLQNCRLSSLPDSLADVCHLKILKANSNRLNNSAAFPAHIFVYLVDRLDAMDLSDNRLYEMPHSFLLTPTDKTALVDSLVTAMKQQPVWINDKCCIIFWHRHLIEQNRNVSLRTYYSSKYATLFGQIRRMSSNEIKICADRYAAMWRGMETFSKLPATGLCQELKREKNMIKRLRRELLKRISSSYDDNILSNDAVFSEMKLKNQGDRGANMKPRSFRIRSNDSKSYIFEIRPLNSTYPKSVDGKTENAEAVVFPRKKPIAPKSASALSCGNYQRYVNILGYILATNFAVFLASSLICLASVLRKKASSTISLSFY